MFDPSRPLGVLALALAATSVQAGAPLLSEDAGVLAAGDCEVEVLMANARAAGVSAKEQAAGLSCGAGSGWQWSAGVAHAKAGGNSARGLALGGKITLWTIADDAALVLAPTLGWSDDGSGWRQATQDLNLVYSGPLVADWTLHLNLGHGRDREADQRSTGWSVAAEHAGFDLGGLTLAPMGDIAGDDRGAPWWNLGLRATLIADRAWLGLSYARQMDPQRARLATLSLKFAF
jgi:hypothetical protein